LKRVLSDVSPKLAQRAIEDIAVLKNPPRGHRAHFTQPTPASWRSKELRKIFRLFDLDSSGVVEASELLILGQRRQALGQKARVWDEAKNTELVRKMDTDGDGVVEEKEFVKCINPNPTAL